jgi:hypothetical protein
MNHPATLPAISSVRLGFATNSSSSHSIVLLGKGKKLTENSADGSFGWEGFVLTKPESKAVYLASILRDSIVSAGIPENVAERIVLDWFSEFKLDANTLERDGTLPDIDHQSKIILPDPTTLPERFIRDLVTWFSHPRVAILGGNDNSDGFNSAEETAPLSRIRGANSTIVRDDGTHWTLFSRYDGTKLRIGADPFAKHSRALTPELVDLKITNRCDAGCAFCYQGSTSRGIHAPLTAIEKILDDLAELKVLEVAIGGGEPTEHPEFAEIIKAAAFRGIVPNFTTYSDRWLSKPDLVKTVATHCGGIGVSVNSAADVAKVVAIRHAMSATGMRYDAVAAQHALGTLPIEKSAELVKLMDEEYLPLLLLGYKKTGRGAGFPAHDSTSPEAQRTMLRALENRGENLSVDTAIVETMPILLDGVLQAKALVSPGEGLFSCYLDAVTGRMAPSSYADKDAFSLIPETAEAIARRFRSYADEILAEKRAETRKGAKTKGKAQ